MGERNVVGRRSNSTRLAGPVCSTLLAACRGGSTGRTSWADSTGLLCVTVGPPVWKQMQYGQGHDFCVVFFPCAVC